VEDSIMANPNGTARRLRALLLSVALNATTHALAFDTGIRVPPKSPPDVVSCGDPATSRLCFECETGGTSACCRDPNNCVVVDATSGAGIVHDYTGGAPNPPRFTTKSVWGRSSTLYAR
jgi:hypothetical protein